eukprot:CAMPEP_0197456376 /NCGR_PEP_ID=MMETSP1175-20131217/43207_1 /TAXON_ID=1003142 /ORGANISM="Triceratium dubium, Strain CCMP147" /LENGTH=112 /DNA_ID=CAMNT_0042990439 /DNA_START=152 /DNA_END=486 /DNA_ORIENTATION=-
MPPNVRHRGGEGALSPSSASAGAAGGEDAGIGRPPLQGSLSTPSGLGGAHRERDGRPSSMRLRPLPPAANGDRPQPLRRNSTPNPDTDLDAEPGPVVPSSSAQSAATWRVGT